MSEKFVETPIKPHSSRRDIADHINRAFSTSDITAICQRLRGVQPSVASSDDHKIALNVRSGSRLCEKAKTLDRDRTSHSFNTALGVHAASPFKFEIEFENIILVPLRVFEFSHSLGHKRT